MSLTQVELPILNFVFIIHLLFMFDSLDNTLFSFGVFEIFINEITASILKLALYIEVLLYCTYECNMGGGAGS